MDNSKTGKKYENLFEKFKDLSFVKVSKTKLNEIFH